MGVKVQPIADMMPIDTFKNSAFEVAPLLLFPTIPRGPAPLGFVRKHQNVLVAKPEVAFTKIPQDSALTAVAALRPGNETARHSDSTSRVQPVAPVTPAEKPLKK